MPVLQHSVENLLNDILGRVRIDQLPQEEVVELLVVFLEQVAQLIEIAVTDGKHQLMIRHLNQLESAPFLMSW